MAIYSLDFISGTSGNSKDIFFFIELNLLHLFTSSKITDNKSVASRAI